jgi:chloride channel 2
MLSIAAGVGVTATFGTPLAGVIYSVETVTTFIAVSQLWKSYLACSVAAIWY